MLFKKKRKRKLIMEYSREFLERLREEIISDEGCVLEVYKDHLGYYTVGVGHLIRPSDEEWETPQAQRLHKQEQMNF